MYGHVFYKNNLHCRLQKKEAVRGQYFNCGREPPSSQAQPTFKSIDTSWRRRTDSSEGGGGERESPLGRSATKESVHTSILLFLQILHCFCKFFFDFLRYNNFFFEKVPVPIIYTGIQFSKKMQSCSIPKRFLKIQFLVSGKDMDR